MKLWDEVLVGGMESGGMLIIPHLDLDALPALQGLAVGVPGVDVLHLGDKQIGGV